MEPIDLSNNYSVRQFVGEVFEEYVATLLGAIRVPRRAQYAQDDIAPDAELPTHDAWLEIKATQRGRYFKASALQLQKYASLASLQFPYSNFYYALLTHSTLHISKSFTCPDKLKSSLLNSITGITVVSGKLLLEYTKSLVPVSKWEDIGFHTFYALPNPVNTAILYNTPSVYSLKPYHYGNRVIHVAWITPRK